MIRGSNSSSSRKLIVPEALCSLKSSCFTSVPKDISIISDSSFNLTSYIPICINSSNYFQIYSKALLMENSLYFSSMFSSKFVESEATEISIESPVSSVYTYEFLGWLMDDSKLGILNEECLFLFIVLGRYFQISPDKWNVLLHTVSIIDFLLPTSEVQILMNEYWSRDYIDFNVMARILTSNVEIHNNSLGKYAELVLKWIGEEKISNEELREELERSFDFYAVRRLFEANPAMNCTYDGNGDKFGLIMKYPIASSAMCIRYLDRDTYRYDKSLLR